MIMNIGQKNVQDFFFRKFPYLNLLLYSKILSWLISEINIDKNKSNTFTPKILFLDSSNYDRNDT